MIKPYNFDAGQADLVARFAIDENNDVRGVAAEVYKRFPRATWENLYEEIPVKKTKRSKPKIERQIIAPDADSEGAQMIEDAIFRDGADGRRGVVSSNVEGVPSVKLDKDSPWLSVMQRIAMGGHR